MKGMLRRQSSSWHGCCLDAVPWRLLSNTVVSAMTCCTVWWSRIWRSSFLGHRTRVESYHPGCSRLSGNTSTAASCMVGFFIFTVPTVIIIVWFLFRAERWGSARVAAVGGCRNGLPIGWMESFRQFPSGSGFCHCPGFADSCWLESTRCAEACCRYS